MIQSLSLLILMASIQEINKSKLFDKEEIIQPSQHSFNAKSSKHFLNLTFSTNCITFTFREADQFLFNEELQIGNHTQAKIYFIIKGIEDKFCDILPNNDIIETNVVLNIRFHMKVKNIMNSFHKNNQDENILARLKDFAQKIDLQFEWGIITDEEIKYNKIPLTVNKQILKIRIVDQSNNILNGFISPEFPSLVNVRTSLQAKQKSQSLINIGDKSHLSSNNKSSKVQKQQAQMKPLGQSKEFKESNKSKQSLNSFSKTSKTSQKSSFLSCPIITVVAILSFIVGFVTG